MRGTDYGEIKVDNPTKKWMRTARLLAPVQSESACPMDRIFPPGYKTIALKNNWNISALVQDYVSRANTNSACPFKWSIHVTDNHRSRSI